MPTEQEKVENETIGKVQLSFRPNHRTKYDMELYEKKEKHPAKPDKQEIEHTFRFRGTEPTGESLA